ncbi:hypothetical protein GOP47_0003655 [Adiantum capillus-veneris]|uniref:Pentatricopeptide repeat-containing protein n=1 Tax=Adiantum capillus-veneris TaxID=13818 RepID=A0A9D4V7P8_ADICA|nr:hypothetical protein GOP47_0003655 [Adiantum capillus-veneris]
MGGLKKLEHGWRLLRAKYPQVLRPLASQAFHNLQGCQQRQLKLSFMVEERQTWESNSCRSKLGGVLCNHTLSARLSSSKGSLFASKGYVFKRGLVTQSGYDDDEDLEIELPNASMSDSDLTDVSSANEDIVDRSAGKQQQQKPKSTSSTQLHHADEIDDSDSDEFMVSSPLDTASENLTVGTTDQRRPLWRRLEEASAGRTASLLKDVWDEWTAEGNSLSRADIVYTITILRKRRRYWRALEVSDWVMREKPFELNDMDFGVRVELIAKLQGANKAADYFATIPKVFQTSMVYSILLTAYVEQNKEKEAVSLLRKVEKFGLDHRTYMYNQLMYLYKKNGLMTGVAEVLKTMEEKNVEPDIYTYNLILDVRARKGDVSGMELVMVRIEEDDKVEPDAATFSLLAKGYLVAGLPEKAGEVVEKVAQSPFRKKRIVNLSLLRLYGSLGKQDQLERVWGLVNEGPRVGSADYIAMIRSLGKVGNSCRAEDIFEEMEEKIGSLSVHHYNALLSVYASLGRTQKGESLLKQLAKARLHANSLTYHELVLMYLKAGQEHKAMEVLSIAQKASQTSIRKRPMYSTYQAILDWCAEKGDVKRAEKVIKDLKSAGYSCAYRSYIVLLKAYENGAMSPYGFLDRLRADNIVPNQLIRKQLKMLDGT